MKLVLLEELENEGLITLGRGDIISKDDMMRNPGDYPVYSSSATENGEFGRYGKYMFEDERVTWSIDGGGRLFYRKKHRYSVTTVCGWLKVNTDALITKYVYYCLYFQWLHKKFDYTYKAHPSVIKKIYEIPLITIEEQNAIVYYLDKINEAIEINTSIFASFDELIKSRFVEMFGNPILNSSSWTVAELSKYITFITSGSRGWAKYFTDDGEFFITIKNVKNCQITFDDIQYIVPPDNSEAKRTKVKEGDLLISITADLGRTGVVTSEIAEHGAYINQHLTCIRLDSRIRPLYAAYYLESEAGKEQFRSKNQNGVKAGLNFDAIKSLKIIVPPIEVQDKFLFFVEQTNKLKSSILKEISSYNELLEKKMNEYFG